MTKILLYAVVMIAVPVAAQGPGLFVSGDIPAERVAPPGRIFRAPKPVGDFGP